MGIMTIDGRKVEFTDEKMSFLSFEKLESMFLLYAISQSFPFMERAVCVQ